MRGVVEGERKHNVLERMLPYTYIYSGTSLLRTPLGQEGVPNREVSLIERCPHFRGQNVHNPNVIQWNLSILDTLGTGECP